jgi:hypothetical protein
MHSGLAFDSSILLHFPVLTEKPRCRTANPASRERYPGTGPFGVSFNWQDARL